MRPFNPTHELSEAYAEACEFLLEEHTDDVPQPEYEEWLEEHLQNHLQILREDNDKDGSQLRYVASLYEERDRLRTHQVIYYLGICQDILDDAVSRLTGPEYDVQLARAKVGEFGELLRELDGVRP